MLGKRFIYKVTPCRNRPNWKIN